jgi:hypothetical protein
MKSIDAITKHEKTTPCKSNATKSQVQPYEAIKVNVKASRKMLKVEFLKFSFSTFTIMGYQ